jgi:hypothetical protein
MIAKNGGSFIHGSQGNPAEGDSLLSLDESPFSEGGVSAGLLD